MNVKNDICVIRDSLLDWLREHRHGVMGTVIFHLVLAIFLVCVFLLPGSGKNVSVSRRKRHQKDG